MDENLQNEFLDWLIESEGCSISPKLQFHEFEHGRGIIALEDIIENEELFFINSKCCIRGENEAELRHDHKWLPLMVRLANELSKDEFQPYLKILPQVDCPMIWNPEEQEIVELIQSIGITESQELYDQLCEYVDISLEDYYFIGCLIMAYSFTFDEILMIPFADMLNHHSDHNAQLFEVEDGFVMRAVKPILQGCEVFNTYGDYANIDLLLRYGFIEADNPWEQYWLDDFLGLTYYEETVEGDEDKDPFDPHSAVLEYTQTLEDILAVEPNERIEKVQYIANSHLQFLIDWLETENAPEE
eukprot:NODE_46_length_32145_cov_0.918711.p15 type:complete len:301 gc:universal NODE_46_length_32145_cov_0.918711:2675-3577(+)